jgi:hypothetical protein
MRFPFKVVSDGQGFTTPRPVFHFVVQGSARSKPAYCLLDTGTPDVLVHADLAAEAGIDLTDAEAIDEFALEGELCSGRRVTTTCVATDGRDEVDLLDVPVTFVTPWSPKRQFAGVLGTLGMEHLRVTVCARERWIDLSDEPSWSA